MTPDPTFMHNLAAAFEAMRDAAPPGGHLDFHYRQDAEYARKAAASLPAPPPAPCAAFKVGDPVRFVDIPALCGLTGTIVEVDAEDPIVPYSVRVSNGALRWLPLRCLEPLPTTPEPGALDDAKREAAAWKETAAQFSRNADFYRDLVTNIGATFGAEAYTAEDGSVMDSVLALKVPGLVNALRTDLASARARRVAVELAARRVVEAFGDLGVFEPETPEELAGLDVLQALRSVLGAGGGDVDR